MFLFTIESKFGSFQRQLNVYGFKRLLRGYGDGSYFNDNFQRGRFDLLAKVKRSTAIKAEGDVSPKSKNVSGKSAAVETESSHDFFESFGSFDDFELPPPATETASMSAKRKRLPSISLPEDAEVRQYDLTCTDNDTNSSKSSLTGSLQHAHNLTLEGIIEISLDPFILAEHGEYLYTPYDGSNQIRIKVNTPTPVSTNQRFFADELDEKVDKEFLNGSTLMTENVVQNKDEDGNLLDFLLDFN